MDLAKFGLAVVPALGIVLGGAFTGAAQSGRIARVGYLPSAGTSASVQPTLQAVRQGLAELGYVDGRDIIIEARFAEGRVERLPELAAELLGLNVDIIVTLGGVATRAAKNATSVVPIVFAIVIDPVAGGLVPDRQRPGGNLTMFTSFDPTGNAASSGSPGKKQSRGSLGWPFSGTQVCPGLPGSLESLG